MRIFKLKFHSSLARQFIIHFIYNLMKSQAISLENRLQKLLQRKIFLQIVIKFAANYPFNIARH